LQRTLKPVQKSDINIIADISTHMATNLNERTVKIILPNFLGYERVAMASSASLAKMYGFSSERIEDLKTIVAEAAINAMQHGNKGREDLEVVVTIRFKDNAIQVEVSDHGDGMTGVLPKPDIERIINDQEPPVGFGVFLIQELADEVEFNLDPETGHKLKMVVKKDPS
jgi:anti-sigma regulatory factor (Ser/Thr protein kinase)